MFQIKNRSNFYT